MSGAPFTERRAPAPGTVLCGKYRVERELGSGGMGVVLLATHLKLERPVAIKLLPASRPGDPYLAARFLREAKAMARLASDHVVRVLELDETPGGEPVLVMELLEGRDVERALAEGPLAPGRAVDWALQACAALAEAHARGIVHRDVKPANLFVVRRADGVELVKLLDFGISKLAGEDVRLTRTAAGLGSPLFMSPEQLLTPSGVDSRTDVWSLGVTLYRLLSGVAPYDARDVSSLAAQIAARPPTPLLDVAPEVDPRLAAVVMRCLEKDVAARWPSVRAFAAALEPFRAPDGLGSLRAVELAQAQGSAAAPVPVAPPPASGPRTLSHDIPRVEAPAVIPAAPAIAGSLPGALEATRMSPRRAAPRALAAALVVGVAVVGGGLALLRRSPEPVPPVAAPLPEGPRGPALTAIEPAGVGEAPVAPPAPAPPEVRTVTRPSPLRPGPARADAGTGTGGAVERNPADLEIKE